MKLTIEQPKLAATLNKVAAIVEKRNTIAILSNLLIKAESCTLTVTASDLDIEVTASTDADVSEPGATTVSADTFKGIVSKLGKGSVVSLHDDGSRMTVKSGRSNFKLSTLPADDFPSMASDSYDNTADVNAFDLSEMFAKTKFAMSTEETRYYLNGVYLHNTTEIDKDKQEFAAITAVATDGSRLAKMSLATDAVTSSVIVPKKTVNVLSKLLPEIEGDVTLDTSETKLRVTGDGFVLVSKVVDGTYPEYTRVIPTSHTNTLTVDAKAFSAASARVAEVADDRTRAVKLAVSGDVCSLSVHGTSGDANEEIEAEYIGDDLTIGFNSKYLAEMMAQSEGDAMTVKLGGPMDAALFTVEGIDGFVGVNMPMRVG